MKIFLLLIYIGSFFSLVYNYCSNIKFLSNRTTSNTHIQGNNHSMNDKYAGQIVGEELYMNIKTYLTTHLETIFQVRSIHIRFLIN